MRTAPQPAIEGDFALPDVFPLESGGTLRGARLRYAIYGKINAAADNVVLVCHALSGSALVAEWWPAIFSLPGVIDPDHDAVLGVNILGSCYGSTGPASIDPATGRPYGNRFPLVEIRDIVRSQALLLDFLGIARLKSAVGASIGGMQVLEWAIQFPSRVARATAIAVAPLNAMGLGLNHLQRQAIMLDPEWRDGNYAPDRQPQRGLALARALAVCSYKSEALFEERFGRKPDRSGEDPWTGNGRFDVAGYLDHQGEKFYSRFDANSYLAITRMMDLFDPARGFVSALQAWQRVEAAVTLVGISSDWLFPPGDVVALSEAMRAAGARCSYRELVSDHGHDAFLAEPELLIEVLRGGEKTG
ncbi:Homoserine O-acetyltransferase [Acidisarcina polymorpha]|uniref:Homoserine O-acetyltransferase n=1 Tax=Acidisarcina polymorpha TaxID=2211140 RepID=A0A2Z5G861_9BACT|nr:homoserine O-acetyltransferase [Acidisarcina polymorpha]AXC15007.1 Homoserine O-acetyltransferase [Acidisarcina polymorpha]